MMNQAKSSEDDMAQLEDEARSDQEAEEMEVVEEVEQEMPSRYQVLETNSVPHILGRIFSYLDPRSVKRASLVSR